MSIFPATLSDLQTLISTLINDPSNTRYTLVEINQRLDVAQDRWNREVGICRVTDTLTEVTGQNTYSLTLLSGTLIKLMRVTHKGVGLTKRSKQYFDMFASYDWTQDVGTPCDYYIDLAATSGPVLAVRPTPQSGDVGPYLAIEYIQRHIQMVNATDSPFTSSQGVNTLIQPYMAGLAFEVAGDILEHDPTAETVMKSKSFHAEAERALSNIVQIYGDFDSDEPWKLMGGRNWNYKNGGGSSPFNG